MDDLEERLQSHARAFEGLMSLIPAKHYYAQDNADQWSRKKKSKEEKRAAKRAKLDPGNYKSAKDVMDENERKRKREAGLEEDEDEEGDPSDIDAPGKEKPREGMKPSQKKQKKETASDEKPVDSSKPNPDSDAAAKDSEQAEKKRAKAEAKLQKRAEQQQKKEQEKTLKAKAKAEKSKPAKAQKEDKAPSAEDVKTSVEADVEDHSDDDEIAPIDVKGLVDGDKAEVPSTASPSPDPGSPASAIPSASSSSSIVPPADPKAGTPANKTGELDSKSAKSEKVPKLPNVDQDLLKARLQARIEQLRAARKADGLNGKPAKNRQELLEARRRKQEQRKQHKKELRKQLKEDEQRSAAEAELARLRGSGSPLTGSDIFSSHHNDIEQNFSFGRVKFDDGDQMDTTMNSLIHPTKKKGPSDAKTALELAERKNARIASLDEAKRKEIEEKEAWLNAKKKAHGEKVRDDTSLLKKTLKRKEKQKSKSEKEWTERIRGVEKGKEMRQKKREENLRKRREEKGSKKGKGGKKVPSKKTKARPGFEGSFRSKAK